MDLIILLSVIQVAFGTRVTYYHEQSVATLQPPDHLSPDSFFGFSTTYDRYNKRLVVSAPREHNIGEVYECNLRNINNNSCTVISNPFTKTAPESNYNYWFGATVKSGSNFVLACCPRYTNSTQSLWTIALSGRCYRRKEKEDKFQDPFIVEQNLYSGQKNDTAGWSLDIAENDAIIIGGPGTSHSTGIAAILPNEMKWHNQFERIDKIEDKAHHFGYSVAIGYFLDEHNLSYAVSSTDSAGQVYFYKYYNSEFEGPLKLEKGIDTKEVGSMYGAALSVAKINQFGKRSDIIVGAPTYASDSGYDSGAVYVYLVQKNGFPPQFKRRIIGQKSGSYFGHAIISVGDLNGDSHEEIAIGAPYEGNGVVYLYSGADIYSNMGDNMLKWLQRIESTGFKSFGFSLTALQDYDDNGCNELAVSAPFEDRVMFYKCIAAVTITKLYAIFPSFKNHTKIGKDKFEFQVCMDLKYPLKPKSIAANLSTDVEIHHTYAKLSNPNNGDLYTFKINLVDKEPTYCQELPFTLPLDGNYSTGITYKITTKLLNNPEELKEIDSNSIILSDTSVLTYIGTVWAATCDGKECVPNLSMTITSNMTERPFNIGSYDQGSFSIEIQNTGDIAYNPCVEFDIAGATLQKLPMDCFKHRSIFETWICVPRNSVATNETWVISDIIVDLRSLTNQNQNITMTAKIFEICNMNPSQVSFYNVPLTSDFKDVSISGITNIGDIFIAENTVNEVVHFTHIYTITNHGLTSFKGVTAVIEMNGTAFFNYSSVVITNENTIWDGTYKSCKEDPHSARLNIICPIDNLQTDKAIKVIIFMDTIPLYLTYEILHIQSIMANSTLYLDIPNYSTVNATSNVQSTSISTLISKKVASFNWRTVDGGMLGLALFIVLSIMLHECGYLKREHKEALKKLKEHVMKQRNVELTNEQLQNSLEQEPPKVDKDVIFCSKEDSEDEATHFVEK